MSDPAPEQIAAKLSPAQRRAMLWLPEDRSWRPVTDEGVPAKVTRRSEALNDLVNAMYSPDRGPVYRLTPLGLAVRAIIEKEGGKDE